jgi:crossover junction endodeoxyribonuclease RuvC
VPTKVERVFVIGVDPGLSRCGYGAVVRTRQGPRAAAGGVILTPVDEPVAHRLAGLAAELRRLFAELRPDVVVVERVLFQTNARTAMGVGQASGLALVAAIDAGAEVVQYSPNEVKLSVTGYGAATKAQVQTMVQRLLELPEPPKPPDVADALALALCHLAAAPLAARIAAAESGAPRPTPVPTLGLA